VSTVTDVLRLPTYRRFLIAAICSGVGVWIFQTAIYWAALQTGSTGSVGILVAVISIPSLVLTLPAGILTDRAGPFRLLVIGQAAPALACLAGMLAIGPDGAIATAPAAAVTLVAGTAYALWSVPALVYVTRIVEPRLLGSAIGLMVVQYAIGRMVGGSLGGLVVSVGGAGSALALCVVIFGLGTVATLSLPRVAGLELREGPTIRGMIEAGRWMRRAPATIALVTLSAIASMFSYAYIPLLGALSRDVIGAGSAGLGLLTAVSGIGMLISAVVVNALGARVGRGRSVAATMITGAIAMAVLGQSSVLLLSAVVVAVVAFLGSVRGSIGQFLVQALAPPRMRGRIASLGDFSAQVMAITGSLAAGALAASFGASATLLAFSVAIIVLTGLVAITWPSLLKLDVDPEARPLLAGVPYAEGVPYPQDSLGPIPGGPDRRDS
jgi:MFS family permease